MRLILAAACLAAVLAVGFVAPLPLWSGQPRGPLSTTSAAPVSNDLGSAGVWLAAGYLLVVLLAFRAYALAMRDAASDPPPARRLWLLTAALAATALLIFPTWGSDVFVYAAYERLWVIYGEHALLAAPALHPEDWAATFAWLPHQPSPYGPLWPLLTWPIVTLASTSATLLALGYKLLMLLAYAACCALVWQAAPGDRGARAAALVGFAWSPLVLFDTLGKAHNDILLALAALVAVRLGGAGGIVAATVGGLVKISGLAIAPAVAVDLVRRRRWRALAIGAAAAILIAALAYAPFWQGPATLAPVLVQTSRVVWSPGSLPIAFGVDPTLVRFVLGAGWLVLTIACLRHEREPASLAALLMLATTLLLTTAFFAHYLVPIVALASISTRAWLRQLALLLSVGALGAYSVEFLAASMPHGWIGSGGYQAAGSLLTLAPATAWLATHALRRTTTLRVSAARRDLSIRSSRRAGPGGGSAAGRS